MADHDTAAVLTEALDRVLAACDLAEAEARHVVDDENMVATGVVRWAARLAAQPPQDDPQPDEREVLAEVLWTQMWRGDGGVTFAQIGHHRGYYLDLAAGLLAAGFRRDPDAGLRETREATWDEALRWVRAQSDVTSPEYVLDRIDRAEPFNPYRAALAEPTPGSDRG